MRCVSSNIGILLCWILLLTGMVWPTDADAQYFRFGKNKVQYKAQSWSYLQSKHFDVFYYEGGHDLADFTAKAAEDALVQVSNLFQHQISKRIPLVVYQSHNDFAVTNVASLPAYSEGIGGVTELFKNRIALPFTGDYRDFRRVIHHELVHAVINDMFYGGSIQSIIQNNIQLEIPDWFNEGLAEYAALGWDTRSDMYMREAILDHELPPIPYLYSYYAYRGGQSVWDYIAEQYGRPKISEILQRLYMTRSVESSIQQSTGLSLAELSERWQKALREIHFPELAAREALDDIARPILTSKNAGFYNTNAALSPLGDKVAYITTLNGLFDVYIANTSDGTIEKKLIAGQTSEAFESLRILTPGLTWSPDGTHIALAVKSGASDAIAVIPVATGIPTHYRIPDIDQILTVSWSPTGNKIAFEGSQDAQSDLYVLDLDTRETINYTNDIFSDHEPAWSPDGSSLVFHSDRGAYTQLGHFSSETFQILDHDYSQFELYRLSLGDSQAQRLTFDEAWDETSARFGPDPNLLLFLSDRNGISNLYEKDLTTGHERPMTDVEKGIIQFSLSHDGQKAALVSLKEGTPSIYLLKTPFERRLEQETLTPNVWAQRLMQETRKPAPALALASSLLRQGNPFLRDATDGKGYPHPTRGRNTFTRQGSASSASLQQYTVSSSLASPTPESGEKADSIAIGDTSIDFRNPVFSADHDLPPRSMRDPFAPIDHVDEKGIFKGKKYKLRFSPDLIHGTAGYDALYGVQGITQMMFSDMLGNHQIFLATNLLIDLRNSDYLLGYHYLPERIDWSASAYHISRMLLNEELQLYRFRRYGFNIEASYPLDKFHRVDVEFSLLGISQANVSDPSHATTMRSILYPGVTYTKDVTTPGFLYPSGGYRMAFSLHGSPGSITGNTLQFISLLGETRYYHTLNNRSLAFSTRASGGASLGPNQQLFYTSGVQNWINRSFDPVNGFPINDVSDFVFSLPVLPLRGHAINTQNGSYFGLVNAELRFPLVAALLPGPLPFLPLQNIQGTTFVDAGAIWGGRGSDKRLTILHRDENGHRVFGDLLMGTGVGMRTLFLGYPIRLDYAWPFNGRQFGKRQLYFSIGLDF